MRIYSHLTAHDFKVNAVKWPMNMVAAKTHHLPYALAGGCYKLNHFIPSSI